MSPLTTFIATRALLARAQLRAVRSHYASTSALKRDLRIRLGRSNLWRLAGSGEEFDVRRRTMQRRLVTRLARDLVREGVTRLTPLSPRREMGGMYSYGYTVVQVGGTRCDEEGM
jgi:hypothetical protein